MKISVKCLWTIRTRLWLVVALASLAVEVMALSGPNVCMVKQKYNITRRIKYRAPMSVRTYEWCFSMPPRCSKWNTEMKELTKLETEERTAEVAVCCPGYKMRDVSCVPICPNGKTGPGCSEDCQPKRWGPNCVHECQDCSGHGACSPVTGECVCHNGWQGESCETLSTTTTSTTPAADLLTTSKAATKPSTPSTTAFTLLTTSISTTSTAAPTTMLPTTLPTTTITVTTPKIINIKPQIISASKKKTELKTATTATIQSTSTYKKPTPEDEKQTTFGTFTEETTQSIIENSAIYNRTEVPVTKKSTYPTELTSSPTQSTATTVRRTPKPIPTFKLEKKQTTEITTTEAVKATVPTTVKEVQTTSATRETSRKIETTIRFFPTTIKFKPKEIWIRPAQKGESPVTEIKAKVIHDAPVKYKNATKIEILPNTTPKTIIVSIIPTSVSYATFKKIALTTASYLSHKNTTVIRSYSKSEGITKPMSVQTSTAIPSTKLYSNSSLKSVHFTTTLSNPIIKSVPTAPHLSTSTSIISTAPTSTSTTTELPSTKSVLVNKKTNSMTRTSNEVTTTLNSSNSLTMITIPSTNITPSPRRHITVAKTSTPIAITEKAVTMDKNLYNKGNVKDKGTESKVTTVVMKTRKEVDSTNGTNVIIKSANTKTNTTVTTERPQDEETFHILTEPEHITAVMSEKGTERTSVDLISVISIAGGVMMAVITVAVIIVMIERCKRPRYEDVRKVNDIRMQVMIDNNDVPPPYVRSIFHTPLPDPPNLEKCHYQPISTLDRNLKQFMRPVVVQTISPIMLENFRGILECHYDHLPRRSQEFGPQPAHCFITPTSDTNEQLNLQRASLTESAIDALKCEAKLDVIDSSTSEPLYAEIPCWRPPSEHAIEIMNFNGEAVTEL